MDTVAVEQKEIFKFKKFEVRQSSCKMKVGTDGILAGVLAPKPKGNRVLDIGTGTGIIALMLAQRFEDAQIDALEIDEQAIDDCSFNFDKSQWKDRLQLIRRSVQDHARTIDTSYDLIVSNPPFFTGGVLSYNQDRNTARHTIKLSHADLLRSVQSLLAKAGQFCCILPFIEGKRFIEMAKTYGLHNTSTTAIHSYEGDKVIRLMLCFELIAANEVREDELVIYQAENQYSKQYTRLTADFYQKSMG